MATTAPAPSRVAYVRPSIRTSGVNPLRFERRQEVREAASGTVSASYRGDGRFGITQFEIIDISSSGMGVATQTRIEPGMIVTIGSEGSATPRFTGRAVRCTADREHGFRVGLVFDRRAAA